MNTSDSGHDGGGNRVREFHLRERRRNIPVHRALHDPSLRCPHQHHPHEPPGRIGRVRHPGNNIGMALCGDWEHPEW